jgi:hypothetical protein
MNPRRLATLLLTAPLAAQAQDAQPLAPRQGFEHVLPADTLAFLGVSDVEQMSKDFRASSSGRFWYDPACSALRETLSDHVDVLTSQVHAELGVDPLELLDMLHGRVALALVGPAGTSVGGPGDMPAMALVLLADVGEDRDRCAQVVDALVARVAEASGAVRKSNLLGETEVSVIEMEAHDGDGTLRLNHAFHGGTLLVTFEKHPMMNEPLDALLARLDGEPGEVLADRPQFRGSIAAQAGGLQGWADLGRVMDFVHDAVAGSEDEEDLQIMERLGLFDLGCLSFSSRYANAESRFDMSLDWGGGGWIPSFMRLLCVSGPAGTLDAVPQDCRSAVAARLDFGGLFDTAVKALMEAGEVEMSDVTGFLAESEEMLGFNLRDDLLDALDGQVTVVTAEVDASEAFMGTEADPQNYALLIGLADGQRINTLVEAAVRKMGLHAARQRQEFQGYEMYNVPVFPGIEVNYAILPDMAVISLSGTLLQDVLRRKAGGDLPDLAGDADFSARAASLLPQPGMLQYTDTAGSVKGLFRALGGMSELFEDLADDAPDELAGLFSLLTDLPMVDEAVIEKHFAGASVTAMAVDERGLHIQTVSP